MCFVCVEDVEWEELDWGDLGWVIRPANVPESAKLFQKRSQYPGFGYGQQVTYVPREAARVDHRGSPAHSTLRADPVSLQGWAQRGQTEQQQEGEAGVRVEWCLRVGKHG